MTFAAGLVRFSAMRLVQRGIVVLICLAIPASAAAHPERLTAFVVSSGRRERVRIVKISADSVTVDGNHPLAGKAVELEISLLSLDSSSNANKQNPQFDLGGQG